MAQLPQYISRKDVIVQKIHAALERERAESEKRTGLRLSEIGGCARYLWAVHSRGEQPAAPTAEALAIFDFGHMVEELVCRWLELADMPVFDRQETAVMDLGNDTVVLGHVDGFVEFNGEPVLLEVKSAKAEQWEQCKKRGYAAWQPRYFDQVQAYLGATGTASALVIAVNKNTSEIYAERIRFDPDVYASLVEKARNILTADKAPARIADSGYKAPCRFCSLSASCWLPTWDVQFQGDPIAEQQAEIRKLGAEYRSLK